MRGSPEDALLQVPAPRFPDPRNIAIWNPEKTRRLELTRNSFNHMFGKFLEDALFDSEGMLLDVFAKSGHHVRLRNIATGELILPSIGNVKNEFRPGKHEALCGEYMLEQHGMDLDEIPTSSGKWLLVPGKLSEITVEPPILGNDSMHDHLRRVCKCNNQKYLTTWYVVSDEMNEARAYREKKEKLARRSA
ncbi:hypothetical protein MVES1_001452 [Malassezia vespertilionis]|uniref:uncharacterized protein n=1 Tax=Malassezia vespertilionis TaxID=2020962 RepID=UPI0024B0976B|nr:uncharacterized protein MVES1_001452 [Malassezia vespertilionis]WFD06111.1 hypothetical protein MVES1_001452 [Malassezia vespertilionis]